MQDVSDKLLGQFVACLEQRLAAPEPEPAPQPAPEPEPVAETAATTSAAPLASAAPKPSPPPPRETEALDLGSAVLPVILKSYWKHALAAVVGLAVVRRLLRR